LTVDQMHCRRLWSLSASHHVTWRHCCMQRREKMWFPFYCCCQGRKILRDMDDQTWGRRCEPTFL